VRPPYFARLSRCFFDRHPIANELIASRRQAGGFALATQTIETSSSVRWRTQWSREPTNIEDDSMTTYSQSDLATRVLRDLGLIGAEEACCSRSAVSASPENPPGRSARDRSQDRSDCDLVRRLQADVAELHPTAVELSASLDRLSSRIHRLPERDGR
jgi:hypothetical protein